MAYKFNPFTKKPDYYETGSSASATIDDVARDNIVTLAWKLAISDGLSRFNLEDGVIDEFEDETGIDTSNSINESYNSTDDCYSPSAGSVVDNMEYATDALAQAAYVTNGSTEYGGTIDSHATTAGGNYTAINDNAAYLIGKAGTVFAVKYYTSTASVNVKFKVFRVNGSNYDLVGESETFTTVAGGATRTLTTPITGVQANDIVGFYLATNLDNAYSSSGKSGCKYIATDITTSTAIATWTNDADGEFAISAVVTYLQSYSESTIKEQGSYSLKGVAASSASLCTLTRTLASTIDLSGVSFIKLDLRSDRLGNNLAFAFRNSGSVMSSFTPSLASTGTWTSFVWSLDSVSNAAKDAISTLYISLINTSASNTFYVDNWVGPLGNMTLISSYSEAEAQPTTARFLALVEPVDSVTINTDLEGYVSEDNGSNYDKVTLTDEGYFDSSKKILAGNVTLTDRSDKTMRQKLITSNAKDLKVHAWGLLWK